MNDHRRRLFRGAEGEIAFLCECGDDACTRAVLLSARHYDRVRREGLTILHRGHARA